MARPTEEFLNAWRGLSGFPASPGWQTLPISAAGPCSMRAGRRFPGNEEALLVHFAGALAPPATYLPHGQGFTVERAEQAHDGWLALSRQATGGIELFAMMAADVAGAMDANVGMSGPQLLKVFLGRVRAWQDFMKAGSNPLSLEAELGLVGELAFFNAMLSAGMDSATAVQAWVGPLDAPQDFVIGSGAIEVKSTLASVGFRAKIGSLEQLDDTVRTPLFLAAARFVDSPHGATLPERARAIKADMAHDPSAINLLADRLLAAGYLEAHADRYVRRFVLTELKVIEVNDSFPRITPGGAPDGVLQAKYQIDVDRATGARLTLNDALTRLGAI